MGYDAALYKSRLDIHLNDCIYFASLAYQSIRAFSHKRQFLITYGSPHCSINESSIHLTKKKKILPLTTSVLGNDGVNL